MKGRILTAFLQKLLAQSGLVLLANRASAVAVFDAFETILISLSLLCFFLLSAH